MISPVFLAVLSGNCSSSALQRQSARTEHYSHPRAVLSRVIHMVLTAQACLAGTLLFQLPNIDCYPWIHLENGHWPCKSLNANAGQGQVSILEIMCFHGNIEVTGAVTLWAACQILLMLVWVVTRRILQ
jgi:hypothetical protein